MDVDTENAERYDAFLSYSHDDEALARRLSTRIRRYRPPRRAGLGSRRLTVFRDVEWLTAGADLAALLEERVKSSRKLVLLCSPSSAASEYVEAEVRKFVDLGGLSEVLFVLCRGEFAESLPPCLADVEQEPLFIDLRDDDRRQFRWESLRLIAALFGMDYAELRREDEVAQRKQRTIAALTGVTTALVLGSAYLIAATATETWLRVPQPPTAQDLMPVHAIAVDRQNPSTVLYKGQDAYWGTNPRPQGYTLLPDIRVPEFEQRVGEFLLADPQVEAVAIVSLKVPEREGAGTMWIYGFFDEKGKIKFLRSLDYSGETTAGEAKRVRLPPTWVEGLEGPFNLSPWPSDVLEREGLMHGWDDVHGTIHDLIGDTELQVKFELHDLDEGYAEWVEVWGPENLVFTNADTGTLRIDGQKLGDIENESDLWDSIVASPEWVEPQVPKRLAIGVAEVLEREQIREAADNIPNLPDYEAFEQALMPLLQQAEFNDLSLISIHALGTRADIIEVIGLFDSPELSRGVAPLWLFRAGDSKDWQEIRLPVSRGRTTIIGAWPLDRTGQTALLATEQKGLFRTDDGGGTWTDITFGEGDMVAGGRLKIIVARPAPEPVVYALVDRNRAFTDGENSLFRLHRRGWVERWLAGLVGVLQ